MSDIPSVGTAFVTIRINSKGFEASLDKMLASMSRKLKTSGESLGKDFVAGFDKETKHAFDALTVQAEKNVNSVTTKLGRLGDFMEKVGVRGSTSMNKMNDSLEETVDVAGRVREAVDGVAGALNDAASDADRMGTVLNRAGGGGGGSLRKLSSAAGGASNSFDALFAAGNAVRAQLDKLFYTAAFGGTAIAGLIGSVSSLAQGFFVMGSYAASAAPSLFILTNAAFAAVQAFSVLKLATAGVGKALKEGFAQETKAGVDNSKALRDATQRLAEARLLAARAAADAARRVVDAEQDVRAAQSEVLIAQKALNAARKEGLEQLEDIAFAAEDAALAEERASLNLEDAYAALQAVSSLPVDDKTRREAELAFKEAELSLREARDRSEDADREQKKAAKSGLKGTEAVRDAEQKLFDTKQSLVDAEEKLIDARRAQAETAQDNARRIADAQQAIGDATATSTTEVDKFADALGKLSGPQQGFVTRILGMKAGFDSFKKTLSIPIFNALNDAIDTFKEKSDTPVFVRMREALIATAEAIGRVITRGKELFFSGPFSKSFANIIESNVKIIESLGNALVNLIGFFVKVGDAGKGTAENFAAFIEKSTRSTSTVDELRKSIRKAADVAKDVGSFFKELGTTVLLFGEAGARASKKFKNLDGTKGHLSGLTGSLAAFNTALEESKGQKGGAFKGLVENLGQALQNFNAIGRALRTVFKPLIEIGQDKAIQEAFDKIADSKAFEKLGDTFVTALPGLTDFVLKILDLVAAISEADGITIFFDVLNGTVGRVVDGMTKLVETLYGIKLPDWAPDFLGGSLLGAIIALFVGVRVFKLLRNGLRLLIGTVASGTASIGGNFTKLYDRIRHPLQQSSGAIKGFGDSFKKNFNAARFNAAQLAEKAGQATRTEFQEQLIKLNAEVAKISTILKSHKAEVRTAGVVLGKEISLGIKEGLVASKGTINTAMTTFASSTAFRGPRISTMFLTSGKRLGAELIKGLKTGISGGKVGVTTEATKIGAAAVAALKTSMGVKSPSRFGISAGKDLDRGVVIGIKTGTPAVTAASAKMGKSAAKVLSASVKQGTASAKAAGVSAGTAVGRGIGTGVRIGIVPGTVAAKASLRGVSIAARATSVAARGLGGAFRFAMGPLFTIMFVIELLLPLFKKLYKENETFRGIIDKIVSVLKKLGSLAGDAFGKIIDAVGKVFNFIKEKWPFLLAILGGPFGLVVLLIVKNFDKILAFIKGVPGKIKRFLKGAWSFFSEAAKTVFKKVKDFFIGALKFYASIPGKVFRLLGKIWNFLFEKAKTAFVKVKDFFLGAFRFYASVPGKIFDILKNVWGFLFEKIKSVFSNIKGFITDKLIPFVKGLPAKFKDGLAGVWDGLKDGFEAAAKFVVDNINKWLINPLNTILDKVNGPHIPPVVVPGLADGGLVRGQGGPRADKVLRRLSNGEYVLPTKSVRSIGHADLEYMRRYGKLPDKGGLWGAIKAGGSALLDGVTSLGNAIKNGTKFALEWAVNQFASKLPKNFVTDLVISGLKNAAAKFTSLGAKLDDKAAAASSTYTGPPGGWTYPVGRRVPISQYPNSGHSPTWAVDLDGVVGDVIRAASAGKVIAAGFDPLTGYGNRVIIAHANGITTLYAHLERVLVKLNQKVGTGKQIGIMGTTGHSTGVHLHFEAQPGSDTVAFMRAHGVRLAKGGIAKATDGGILSMIAEAGRSERIEPLDQEGFSKRDKKILELIEQLVGQNGKNGDTYNIHPSRGMSETELALLVSRKVTFNGRRGA